MRDCRSLHAIEFRQLSYNDVNSPDMIAQDLLDILACPHCKMPLTLIADGQKLKCNQCLRVFPIRDGIPILLIDEAVIETR